MQEVPTTQKQKTFLKDLASHAIKIIIGAIVVAVMGGIGSSFVIYNKIETTLQNDIKQDEVIMEAIQKIEKIDEKVGGTKINTAVSEEKMKAIENQLDQLQEQQRSMQQNQLDILKILGEMNRRNKN